MDKITLQKAKDALAKSNSIGIAVGKNPSVDEMGAALSLYLLLKAANKRVSIAGPTEPIVEISSLVGIDKVQRSFGGDAGDLVVSFPYQEGEIEKVSYTLENNFLNIIVKSSEKGLSFDEKDVRYSRGSGSIDLLVTVGVAQLNEIEAVIDSQKLGNISIINIDTDAANQGFGDVVLHASQASSLSEHVADIVLALGFTIEQDAAQNLLSGIMSATNNFQDPKTSSLAFEISAFLMKRGAQRISNQGRQRPQIQQSYNNQPQQQEVNDQVDRPMPRPQPAQRPMPSAPKQTAANHQQNDEDQKDAPPLDWLTPKVYKGSSEV